MCTCHWLERMRTEIGLDMEFIDNFGHVTCRFPSPNCDDFRSVIAQESDYPSKNKFFSV